MKYLSNVIFLYVLIIGVAIVLSSANIIEISISKILSFTLILVGMGTVFFLFGSGKKFLLFGGSILFFSGMLVYLTEIFPSITLGAVYVPATGLILGLGFFLLFLEDFKSKFSFYSGLFLITSSLLLIAFWGRLKPFLLWSAVKIVAINYWQMFLFAAFVVFFIAGRMAVRKRFQKRQVLTNKSNEIVDAEYSSED